MTQGYQLDQLLSLRLLKPFCYNVVLEHGGHPNILHLAVHLDFFEPVEVVILSHFYSLSFFVGGLLQA